MTSSREGNARRTDGGSTKAFGSRTRGRSQATIRRTASSPRDRSRAVARVAQIWAAIIPQASPASGEGSAAWTPAAPSQSASWT